MPEFVKNLNSDKWLGKNLNFSIFSNEPPFELESKNKKIVIKLNPVFSDVSFALDISISLVLKKEQKTRGREALKIKNEEWKEKIAGEVFTKSEIKKKLDKIVKSVLVYLSKNLT